MDFSQVLRKQLPPPAGRGHRDSRPTEGLQRHNEGIESNNKKRFKAAQTREQKRHQTSQLHVETPQILGPGLGASTTGTAQANYNHGPSLPDIHENSLNTHGSLYEPTTSITTDLASLDLPSLPRAMVSPNLFGDRSLTVPVMQDVHLTPQSLYHRPQGFGQLFEDRFSNAYGIEQHHQMQDVANRGQMDVSYVIDDEKQSGKENDLSSTRPSQRSSDSDIDCCPSSDEESARSSDGSTSEFKVASSKTSHRPSSGPDAGKSDKQQQHKKHRIRKDPVKRSSQIKHRLAQQATRLAFASMRARVATQHAFADQLDGTTLLDMVWDSYTDGRDELGKKGEDVHALSTWPSSISVKLLEQRISQARSDVRRVVGQKLEHFFPHLKTCAEDNEEVRNANRNLVKMLRTPGEGGDYPYTYQEYQNIGQEGTLYPSGNRLIPART
ncbi:hypothetical protein BDW22DRAFT_1429079 [Trametopsis cervina]|nr:hypothetical protein BDW22DRAFT_1429079 [Trametopsis cervina]